MSTSVLFVCMGNICRSPMAEGIFRHLAQQSNNKYITDSAGTGAWHVGNLPDVRARATLQSKGIDISDLRARQVNVDDFMRFDYIFAMDKQNYRDLQRLQTQAMQNSKDKPKAKLVMMLDYADKNQFDEDEVPDPYYGGDGGFLHCYDLIDNACRGFLDSI